MVRLAAPAAFAILAARAMAFALLALGVLTPFRVSALSFIDGFAIYNGNVSINQGAPSSSLRNQAILETTNPDSQCLAELGNVACRKESLVGGSTTTQQISGPSSLDVDGFGLSSSLQFAPDFSAIRLEVSTSGSGADEIFSAGSSLHFTFSFTVTEESRFFSVDSVAAETSGVLAGADISIVLFEQQALDFFHVQDDLRATDSFTSSGSEVDLLDFVDLGDVVDLRVDLSLLVYSGGVQIGPIDPALGRLPEHGFIDVKMSGLRASPVPPDGDGDGIADALDNCPAIANAGQQNRDSDGFGNACDPCPDYATTNNNDFDGNGIGDECECGDQTQDAVVNVVDLVSINLAIFGAVQKSPLCDTNFDGLCNVQDIVGANNKIFGRPAYCSRYPPPGP